MFDKKHGLGFGFGGVIGNRLSAVGCWLLAVRVAGLREGGISLSALRSLLSIEGGAAMAIRADVSREPEIIRLFEQVDERFDKLDCLVNNAGILEVQCSLSDMTTDRMYRMLHTNILGPMMCCREAIKRMSTHMGGEGGTIVNVSSIASRTGAPFEYIDYAVTKGGLDTFTIGLANEVANEGIRVNGVRPAFIYTDIHADGGEPDRINRIRDSIPLKRGGRADEVAEAILWLASEKSSYSTGIFIDVTGGK